MACAVPSAKTRRALRMLLFGMFTKAVQHYVYADLRLFLDVWCAILAGGNYRLANRDLTTMIPWNHFVSKDRNKVPDDLC